MCKFDVIKYLVSVPLILILIWPTSTSSLVNNSMKFDCLPCSHFSHVKNKKNHLPYMILSQPFCLYINTHTHPLLLHKNEPNRTLNINISYLINFSPELHDYHHLSLYHPYTKPSNFGSIPNWGLHWPRWWPDHHRRQHWARHWRVSDHLSTGRGHYLLWCWPCYRQWSTHGCLPPQAPFPRLFC